MIDQADLNLLDGFERALLNDKLHLVYQPKVRLDDGSLTRVEALVRWTDPDRGAVPPSRFVPLAERHGLIDPLTRWGLSTALADWRRWQGEGLDPCLAFNISAVSLQHLDFPDLVERLCAEAGVPTDRLVLELTEGATQSLIKLMDTLTRFRIKGIGLAIDDFGTGFSSLSQLRQLPFTEVKIDQMFVTDLVSAPDSQAIVRSIIDLAHRLGLTATAEGIEKPEQAVILREMGCDVGQGYWIARPLPAADLSCWSTEFADRWRAAIDQGARSNATPCASGSASP